MSKQRELTHDEKKASEAAFRGLPFNPEWSKSAKVVYEGILQVLGSSKFEGPEPLQEAPTAGEPIPSVEPTKVEKIPTPHDDADTTDEPITLSMTTGSLQLHSRKEAITAGIMKDATPAAKRIGLEIPVGLTNALWENYVAISKDMTEENIQSRLQDIMIGVRLRLASLKEGVPFVDVPILLHFPPEPVPQVSLSFALFHRDPEEGHCLLLIHPGEIFSPRQNISQN